MSDVLLWPHSILSWLIHMRQRIWFIHVTTHPYDVHVITHPYDPEFIHVVTLSYDSFMLLLIHMIIQMFIEKVVFICFRYSQLNIETHGDPRWNFNPFGLNSCFTVMVPGFPWNLDTKLTKTPRQIKTTFPMNMTRIIHVITHSYVTRFIHGWIMSHINQPCHTWMDHVT